MNAKVRATVLARSNGLCEACSAPHGNLGEVDHWESGRGRRTQRESVETVWVLGLRCGCAKDRTANWPSAAEWNARRAAHCTRYGFAFVPHAVHEPVVRK